MEVREFLDSNFQVDDFHPSCTNATPHQIWLWPLVIPTGNSQAEGYNRKLCGSTQASAETQWDWPTPLSLPSPKPPTPPQFGETSQGRQSLQPQIPSHRGYSIQRRLEVSKRVRMSPIDTLASPPRIRTCKPPAFPPSPPEKVRFASLLHPTFGNCLLLHHGVLWKGGLSRR